MKFTDIIIVFIIITIPLILLVKIDSRSMENAVYKKIELDRIVDTAVTDGTSQLINNINSNYMEINKQKAVNTFYNTLYINLNILSDQYAQNKIRNYIPAIGIVDYNGLYILSDENYKNENGDKEINQLWKPKIPYTYFDDNYVYIFTLDDYVTVYDKCNNQFIDGKQQDIKNNVESEIIKNDELFEQVRRRTIIEILQKELNNTINKHNIIASQYGITYNFSLPVIEKENWYSTIDDVSMIVFFQGFPIGIGNKHYNNYAIGGARLVKKQKFYIQKDENGIVYYHRKGCPDLTDYKLIRSSQQECALEGAIPCNKCNP